jgi:hypothetical protein
MLLSVCPFFLLLQPHEAFVSMFMSKLIHILIPGKDKTTDSRSHLTIGKIQTIIELYKHIKTLNYEITEERIRAIVSVVPGIIITGILIFYLNALEVTKETAPVGTGALN